MGTFNPYVPLPETTVTATKALAAGTIGSVFVNNTSGSGITITLPPNPYDNLVIDAFDVAGTAGAHTITWVGAAGATIGGSSSYLMSVNFAAIKFYYSTAAGGWFVDLTASTYASNAATSATAAASSATAAAGSATTATTQAGNAATSATAAASSATAAASSATGAATSATTATTQATTATTQATTATTQAGIATTQAGNAATSATAAASSATAAAASATAAAGSATAAAGSAATALTTIAGAINGVSVAKTAAYTVANSDKRLTLSFGGSTGYTVTVPSAAGFDSDFQVRLFNADAGRAKTIAITGYSNFFLWPLQSVIVHNIGGTWEMYPRTQRWILPGGGIPMYVDPSGGPTNDGLTLGSAKATILDAWNTIRDQTDGPLFIQLTPGVTYSVIAGGGAVSGELDGDTTSSFGRLIQIVGDPTLVNPPILICGSGQSCIVLRDGAWSIIHGISFKTVGNSSTGVNIQQKALGDIQDCTWDIFPLGYHIIVDDDGDANMAGAMKFVGSTSMLAHIYVGHKGKVLSGASFDGTGQTVAFTVGFIQLDLHAEATFNGSSFANFGSFTGPKYFITHSSFLTQGGLTFPGNASGSADGTSLAF
jgi:hypothetical protein